MEYFKQDSLSDSVGVSANTLVSIFAEKEYSRREELRKKLEDPQVIGRARGEAISILEALDEKLGFYTDVIKRMLMYSSSNIQSQSDVYRAGLELVLQNRMDAAYEFLYDEQIQTNEGDATPYMLKAMIAEYQYRPDEAEGYYKKAIEIDPSYDNIYFAGRFYFCSNKADEARECFNRCLRMELAIDKKAIILGHLGRMAEDLKDYPEAARVYAERLELKRKLAGENPEHSRDFACSLNHVGVLHYNQGEFRKAKECFNEALKAFGKLAKKDPDEYNPALAGIYDKLGSLHCEQTAYAHAEEYYKNALELFKDLVEKDPMKYMPELADVFGHLGSLHKTRKEYDEAQKYHLEALAIYKDLAEYDSENYEPHVAMCLSLIAYSYMENDEIKKAETFFVESLKVYRKIAAEYPKIWNLDLAQILVALSSFYIMHRSDRPRSIKYANEAIKLLKICPDNDLASKAKITAKHVIALWRRVYK